MGKKAHQSDYSWGRAVVIGGGYAGLVAARALADHFEEVVVLERDPVDRDTGVHPSAPQGYHAHAMLAKGAEVLEGFFPGLRAELRDQGAPVFDYGERMSFRLPDGFAPRDRTGVEIQSFTRDGIERSLRRRVLARPEVRLLSATKCEGLLVPKPGTVEGVVYRTDGAADSEELTADLVVDASGRSSPLDAWLEGMGVDVPEKVVVKAKITYTSMNFHRPPDGAPGFDIAYQMTFAPHVPRGGVLLAVENDRWTCSLFGFDDQLPPTDDEGYLDFAKGLTNPHLAEQVERRTEQEQVHRYTNVNNQWRRYHRVKDWPERLIAIGDAVCVFNPVYGQGLTVAALEAQFLHRTLARHKGRGAGLAGLSRTYQRGLARIVLAPWTLSVNSDLMWNPAGQPFAARAAHWYNTRLFAVCLRDPAVWARFVRVANMVAPPTVLFHPTVVAKVLGEALSRRRGGRRT
ncbi:FAD-dependent oxidoreductase [Streptomyces sp. NPDC050504]|uniref:FAD-dependent oxidoreductase n=1 Tax=Streptomyces sp. NPDC050504 TaxID=3365618 RepID=UPI0037B78D8F